jgi:hypothetical protein
MFWGETLDFRDYFRDRKSWHAYMVASKRRKFSRKLAGLLMKRPPVQEAGSFVSDHNKYIWRIWQARRHFKYYHKSSRFMSFYRFYYHHKYHPLHSTLDGLKKYRRKRHIKFEQGWKFKFEFKVPGKELREWKWRLRNRMGKFTTFDPKFIKKFVYSRKRFDKWDDDLAFIKLTIPHMHPLKFAGNRILWWITGKPHSPYDKYLDMRDKHRAYCEQQRLIDEKAKKQVGDTKNTPNSNAKQR